MKSTDEAYYEAPDQIRDLIDSGTIGESIDKILANTAYSNSKAKAIIASTRFFLSLTSESEFGDELRALNFSEEIIQSLIVEMKQILSLSLREISESIESNSNEISSMEQAFTQQYQQKSPEEVVYTSTQSAILHESAQGGQWETR